MTSGVDDETGAGPPGETGRTGERLYFLLKRAGMALAARHVVSLAPLELDARDLGLMLLIDSFERNSQHQLAERLGHDRTTMVALLDGLEQRGLIARRTAPEDRRRNVVTLTAQGRDLLERATEASDIAEAQLLAPLSAEEASQLRELLARVISAGE